MNRVGIFLGLILASLWVLGCDDPSSAPAGDAAPAASSATPPAASQAEGTPAVPPTPPPPPVCKDELVFPKWDDKDTLPTTHCSFPEAYGSAVTYGDKDAPRVALLCMCHPDAVHPPSSWLDGGSK